MNLRLQLSLAKDYRSPSQIARVITEGWVESFVKCPGCAKSIVKAPNNSSGLDFFCKPCELNFELKSKRGDLGAKVVDGAYQSMLTKVATGTQSNFFLLSYNSEYVVTNLVLVPKRFIVPELIERRKPLAISARRAGWVGCNLKISHIPAAGKIFYIKDKSIFPANEVFSQWKKTVFLDQISISSRGWLIAVMRCVEKLDKADFSIRDVYRFVPLLQSMFPKNKHIEAKIRQQLQVLRDMGWIKFLGGGKYSRK